MTLRQYLAVLLLLFLLAMFRHAGAWDSSQAYNTVAMSYTTNTTIYQTIVLNDAQRASGQPINFVVDVKNGGGRPTKDPVTGAAGAYATQTDKAWVTIYAYNNVGGLIGSVTSQQYTLENWGTSSNVGWSVGPGDNTWDFTQAAVSYTGDISQVAYIKVEMKGTDGAYWAGNYGPQWRTPTVTVGSSSNLAYNSEFGVASNGVTAQGWSTSSGTWSACGVTSGNKSCVTAESGVTANMWGGGEDLNGGTTLAQPGGYASVLTSDNADTAAAGGDISSGGGSGGGSGATPPAPSYNSNITAPQQGRVDAWLNRGNNRSGVYIEQVGTGNILSITQSGNRNNFIDHRENGNLNATTINQTATANSGSGQYMESVTTGSSNTIELRQSGDPGKRLFSAVGSSNSVSVNQKDGGDHYLDLSMTGTGHAATVLQEGSAQHRATIATSNAGGASNISVNQSGATGRVFNVEQTCVSAGGCGVSITQNQ